MNPYQKSFLDDMAALFRKYHIDNVYTRDEDIVFLSNLRELSFERYRVDCDGEEYVEVKISENYKPDEPEEPKYHDDDFDD